MKEKRNNKRRKIQIVAHDQIVGNHLETHTRTHTWALQLGVYIDSWQRDLYRSAAS